MKSTKRKIILKKNTSMKKSPIKTKKSPMSTSSIRMTTTKIKMSTSPMITIKTSPKTMDKKNMKK
jgi:hypothetical protein